MREVAEWRVARTIVLASALGCMVPGASSPLDGGATEAPQPRVISADDSRKSLDSALVMGMNYWSYEYIPSPNEPCRSSPSPFTCLPAPGTQLKLHTGDVPRERPNFFTLPGNEVVMRLRSYAHPKDPERYARLDETGRRRHLESPANLVWSIPGPTFQAAHGDRVNLKLINRLPLEEDPYGHGCDDVGEDPPGGGRDEHPNCFHGTNTTNIHYHGFRGSPKRPQDWPYLELKPAGTAPPPIHYPHKDNVLIGEHDSRLDPIAEIQPVGTHWYHPHKHGSGFMQVLNGSAGAFIIRGYFDEGLERQLPGLVEKMLVLQEIRPAMRPKVSGDTRAGVFWVNGVRTPVIRVAPGEIQRWRFLNTGIAGSSQVRLYFENHDVPIRQVAQDGVPFAHANYVRQPLNLLRPDAALQPSLWDALATTTPSRSASVPEDVDYDKVASFQLAPGNRVDLLVEAPEWNPRGGTRFDRVTKEEYQDHTLLTGWLLMNRQVAPARKAEAAREAVTRGRELLILRVVRNRQGGARGRLSEIVLPPLPEYLSDIDPKPAKKTNLTFSDPKDRGPLIDDKKYSHDRVDHRVKLGVPEEWVFRNESIENHPFHIHINPFQVTSLDGREFPRPWVWWDTIALPVVKERGPGGDAPVPGSMTIRQRFLGFTGDYVLHCHILGHHDRGMMQNVRAEE